MTQGSQGPLQTGAKLQWSGPALQMETFPQEPHFGEEKQGLLLPYVLRTEVLTHCLICGFSYHSITNPKGKWNT